MGHTYTNFVNPLDLCAIAVPGVGGEDGLPEPCGVTLAAPAGADRALLALGARWRTEPLTELRRAPRTAAFPA